MSQWDVDCEYMNLQLNSEIENKVNVVLLDGRVEWITDSLRENPGSIQGVTGKLASDACCHLFRVNEMTSSAEVGDRY